MFPRMFMKMNYRPLVGALLLVLMNVASAAPTHSPHDWPAWRGPLGNGLAGEGQNPPITWSETSNVVWRASLPGRGHGSPTIVGDKVYLATATAPQGAQSVLCLDRRTGKILWNTVVHEKGADAGKHANSSAASSSVACDGEQVYINFLNNGAVFTTALDLLGRQLWQKKVSDYVTHQGFASSPVLHGNTVLVSADHRGGGVIVALDRASGKTLWSQPRPPVPNYTSPAVLTANGQTQVVLAGCNLVSSYEPATGRLLWEMNGSTEECVGSAVTDGTRIFASGGYPKNHTMAVMADGSGKVAWQNTARIYVPSMIVQKGHLYAVMDAGLAVCWKSDTGEELWKERLGGDFFGSPVMVGDRIYATNLRGLTYVFTARPGKFELLAKNQLGQETYASPSVARGQVYIRTAERTGEKRQEYLYCIGHSR